jgi:hypothetical protein
VGFIVSSNWGVRLAFLGVKDLDTLKVETTSIEFVPTMHVEENLLQNNGVTYMLSMTLSTSKLEFLFARAISPNTILKKLMVRHNLEERSNVVIHNGHV